MSKLSDRLLDAVHEFEADYEQRGERIEELLEQVRILTVETEEKTTLIADLTQRLAKLED